MAKCPSCSQDCPTSFFLNMVSWRELVCPHCTARLERKNPQIVVPLTGFWLALLALGRLGHRFAILAEVLMFALFVVILVKFARPELQLRKAPPKPEIRLDLNGS
jgi:hypothetical protein